MFVDTLERGVVCDVLSAPILSVAADTDSQIENKAPWRVVAFKYSESGRAERRHADSDN